MKITPETAPPTAGIIGGENNVARTKDKNQRDNQQ